MKRRLSLAISLIHNPKVLVLDEPTVGMDPLLRNGRCISIGKQDDLIKENNCNFLEKVFLKLGGDAYISGDESEINVLLNNHNNITAAQMRINIQESIKDYMSQKAEESKKDMEELKSSSMITMNNKLADKINKMKVISPEINIDNFYGN